MKNTTMVYRLLDNKWGPHSVDRFASNLNNQCKRFNSRWWCPGTEGVDAFGQSWANEVNWLVPPPRLILSIVENASREE